MDKVAAKKHQDEGAIVIAKMAKVLMRAQRKVDDEKYRNALKSIQNI